jgi:two-component system, chemotaxis family, chemotaxis protein CheY
MARKALVADDDKDARFLWKVIAREQGLDVVEVSNGREALDLLSSDDDIAFAILDVVMPLLTGYKVLQHIRSDERLKTLPVIISTANRTTQALDEVAIDGFTFFVNKASGIENMRKGVAKALEK